MSHSQISKSCTAPHGSARETARHSARVTDLKPCIITKLGTPMTPVHVPFINLILLLNFWKLT